MGIVPVHRRQQQSALSEEGFPSWCPQRTPHLEDLTLSSHLQDKTDFTSRRAKCCLNVTRAKLRLPSSFPVSTSITGTLPEALKGKQVARVGKVGDLPLILKLSKIPFAIFHGGEIFVCQIGLKIHIMKLEIYKHASETIRLKPNNFTQKK